MKDDKKDDFLFTPNDRRSPSDKDKPPTKKRSTSNKSQYLVFLIMTVFVGIVVFILAIAMAFSAVSKRNPIITDKPSDGLILPSSSVSPSASESTQTSQKDILAVVKKKNSTLQSFDLYDFELGNNLSLSTDNKSEFKNKYGQEIVFSEISDGNIVTVNYDTKENKIISLKLNPDSWEKNLLKQIKFDNTKTISINNDTFTYDNNLICVYKGEPFDITKVSDTDLITLRGYKSKLLYVEIVKSHGLITFINKDKIKDGTLEIDTSIYSNLADAKDSYEVSEGRHIVVVKGSNMEPYKVELNIVEGLSEIVDLSKVMPKSGALTIKISPENSILYINDKKYLYDEPIVLEYGTYKIKVEKESFNPQEAEIILKEPFMSKEFNLEEIVQLGKVNIITEPEGAEVYIDNYHIGTSPVTKNVSYGQHNVVIKKDGYTDTNSPLKVEKPTTDVNVILQAVITIAPTPVVTDEAIIEEDIVLPTPEELTFPDNINGVEITP